jgi:hypothetical protein
MAELLRHVRGEDLVFLIILVSGVGGAVSIAFWKLWLLHRSKDLNAELKRDMVAAGMSADEIIRVLEAGEMPKNREKS